MALNVDRNPADLTGVAHAGGATCLGGVLLPPFKAKVTGFAKSAKALLMAELVVFFVTMEEGTEREVPPCLNVSLCQWPPPIGGIVVHCICLHALTSALGKLPPHVLFSLP